MPRSVRLTVSPAILGSVPLSLHRPLLIRLINCGRVSGHNAIAAAISHLRMLCASGYCFLLKTSPLPPLSRHLPGPAALLFCRTLWIKIGPRCCGLFLHGFVRWGAGSHSRFKRDLQNFLNVWNLVGEYPVLGKIQGYFFISVHLTMRSKRGLINYVHKQLSDDVFLNILKLLFILYGTLLVIAKTIERNWFS